MHCLAVSLNYLHSLAFHSGTSILYQFLFSLQSPDQPLLEIYSSIPPVPHPHSFKNMNYFLLFVLILLVFSETPLSSSNPEWYRICGNQFKCGNVSAGFPFWGGDRRLPNCGHPKLQLKCEKNETAILEIEGVLYRVLEINQETKRLKIARDDYEGGICPQNTQNSRDTNLDATLFDSTSGYVYITLLYGCLINLPSLENFSCSFNGVNSSKVCIHQGALTNPKGCSASATVLVNESFAPLTTVKAVEQALKDGFEVKWKVDDEGLCQKCNKSKGSCGINPSNEMEAVCYCREPTDIFQECPLFPLPPPAIPTRPLAPSPPARPPSNANDREFAVVSSSVAMLLQTFHSGGRPRTA
ncbi:hypothetical protein SLEP1_g27347 [Rubroshorea leprosula]|uniref:non-specific serine/threonine protein kinase n=1 Tax=Rubroshorea leprosula TaxID=152421 RepID=A0AAV5JW70_9ROSI|nr:hypothetical protein SLEP1_g27347 [Rubroshorea leprosula]